MLTSSLHNMFFEIKRFCAYNCFIKSLALLRNLCFFYRVHYCHQPMYLRNEWGRIHSKLNKKILCRFWLLFFSSLLFYLDYEKSGKSNTSFNGKFIKTLTIVRVNKDFHGKPCPSVLFNDVTSRLLELFCW